MGGLALKGGDFGNGGLQSIRSGNLRDVVGCNSLITYAY
jgi:hypothetical protein